MRLYLRRLPVIERCNTLDQRPTEVQRIMTGGFWTGNSILSRWEVGGKGIPERSFILNKAWGWKCTNWFGNDKTIKCIKVEWQNIKLQRQVVTALESTRDSLEFLLKSVRRHPRDILEPGGDDENCVLEGGYRWKCQTGGGRGTWPLEAS